MKEELTEQNAIKYAKYVLVITVALMFIALFFIFYFFKYCPNCGKNNYDISESGQFGDTFNGILAPIIALCAAILTFLAFYIQYEANKIQRKGLALQQFDNTFFNLISNHYQIVNGIKEKWSYDKAEITVKGRDIFKKVTYAIKEVFDDNRDLRAQKMIYDNSLMGNVSGINPLYELQLDFFDKKKDGKKLDELFYHFYCEYRSAFSHYFRNLYHIVNFIIEYEGFHGLYDEKKEKEIKKRYIKIIRAQLSSYELVLLWYNSRQNFGKPFGELMIKYELLKNIDFDAEIVLPDLLLKEHPYLEKTEE